MNAKGTPATAEAGFSLWPYVQIARLDHWVKNVFVLPGIFIALSVTKVHVTSISLWNLLIGFLSVGLVASSNYVINELLDAPYDRHHPVKRNRPIPSGRVSGLLAYAEWILLMVAGLAMGATISWPFVWTMGILWVMGCIYNIPPIRSKDLVYLDVLSESVNNPIRMVAGWYMAGGPYVPPATILLSYWMIGCYFMAIKRYAEYREINDHAVSSAYRRSFAGYSESKLLVSIVFYGAHAMLFLGAFIVRYRLELILSFPLIALVMAIYLQISFKADSAAQRPEGLYKEKALMTAVVLCSAVMLLLLFLDMPMLGRLFLPLAY